MFKGENISSTIREDFQIKFLKRKQVKISKKTTKSCSKYPNEKPLSSMSCKSLTNLLEPSVTAESNSKINGSKWNWSTPQLNRKAYSEEKMYDRRKSSEWTKLRNTLEFIQKSRENMNSSHIDERSEKEPHVQHYTSLTFLGQLYNVEIETDEKGEEKNDVFG